MKHVTLTKPLAEAVAAATLQDGRSATACRINAGDDICMLTPGASGFLRPVFAANDAWGVRENKGILITLSDRLRPQAPLALEFDLMHVEKAIQVCTQAAIPFVITDSGRTTMHILLPSSRLGWFPANVCKAVKSTTTCSVI